MRACIPVQIGRNSSFWPAETCDGTLLIFVHGFRGKALSTWQDFQRSLDNDEGLRSADALFYGYPSRPMRVQLLAIEFRECLDEIWSGADAFGSVVSAALKERAWSGRWSRIILVCHSMGAVVVRRAMIDRLRNGGSSAENWAMHAALCLFAPAHTGANVIRLLGESFSFFGIPLSLPMKLRYPCLIDLEEHSQTLKQLLDDFQSLEPASAQVAKATRVVLAGQDRVVEPVRFGGDPTPESIKDVGHISVCKPTDKFLDPVSHLGETLSIAQREIKS